MPSMDVGNSVTAAAAAAVVPLTSADFRFCEATAAVLAASFAARRLKLKYDMIEDNVFYDCPNLTTVNLVGGIHNTVASLHLESWRNEMNGDINRINQLLPNTDDEQKTQVIRRWMRSVIYRLDNCKAEHNSLLKEATTLLELALWKANLDNNEGGVFEKEGVRTTRGQRKRARKEICITSGASIVIKNVLPFLQLK